MSSIVPIPRRDWAVEKQNVDRRKSFGIHNINAGRLREIPAISIDRFSGIDLRAMLFFLTHCHTDHMVGLDEDEFWNRLQAPGVKLYLSNITPTLIPLFGRYLRGEAGVRALLAQNKIVPLNVNQPYEVRLPSSKTTLTVTLLPANHCPGSVMIQFEYGQECILYTGDCRVTRTDLMKMDSLHLPASKEDAEVERKRNVKPITHLYLDTTFCSTRSQDFPGRVDVLDELVGLARKWLARGENNWINLSFSARFSHEYVLMRFHQEFGIKSHVNQERFTAYKSIPVILNSVTPDPKTRFHLCEPNSPCIKRFMKGNGKVLTIRLSSLWFMNLTGPKLALMYQKESKRITVCYAMHSSLDEIADMIDYLKPRVVTPLVLPKGMKRSELETELRRSAKGDYIYEDFVPGFGLTSSMPQTPVPVPALTDTPKSAPEIEVVDLCCEEDTDDDETDFEETASNCSTNDSLDLDNVEIQSNEVLFSAQPSAPGPPSKVARVEWNCSFSETESEPTSSQELL